MERVTIKIGLFCTFDGKGDEMREWLAEDHARCCRSSSGGYNCTVGHLSCPLGISSSLLCDDVTPDDWLKLLEVEE